MWTELGVTIVVVVLTMQVEHWLPWGKILGHRLPRLAAYALGVAGMCGPLTGLFLALGEKLTGMFAVWALWAVAAAGGLAVALAWGVDAWLDSRAADAAAKKDGEILRTFMNSMEQQVDDERTIEQRGGGQTE